MKALKVLVACEESQAVTIEFRKLGHEAYSCDLIDCSGGYPEWHIKGDATKALNLESWDLIIAHPPCTYMSNSGVRWLYNSDGRQNTERWFKLIEAMEFFNKFKNHYCRHIAIENPIPHKYAVNGIADKEGIGKYTQTIQPWQFGHLESKRTCLWLKNLPLLVETNNVYDEMMQLPYGERSKVHYASPGPHRQKLRSKTYSGIAEAMASQWSDYI